MIRIQITTLCALALLGLLISVPANGSEITNPRFGQLSTQHGLSQKTVQSIFQDSKGYLWFGTQEGLNKYDGRKVKVFSHSANKSGSISNNVIRSIVEDEQGNLWIATDRGLNKYLSHNDQFQQVNILDKKGNPIERLTTLFIDTDGTLWVGTNGSGVFYSVNSESHSFENFSHSTESQDDDIRAIYRDSRGRLWLGSDGQGVYLISKPNAQAIQFQSESSATNSLSHNRVRTILEDHQGQIWIGTRGGGVNRYDELSGTFKRYMHDASDVNSLSHDRVYQILEDQQRRLWFATDGGVSIYRKQFDDFYQVKHQPSESASLSHNRVLSIYEDVGGVIWFGTLSGANKWDPITAEFVNYSRVPEQEGSLSFDHIHGLVEDKKGKIFVATFGGGLNQFDPETQQFSTLRKDSGGLSDDYLITLMLDNQEQLWVGTLSKGVEVFDSTLKNQKRLFRTDEASSLSANGVTDILQDSDGEIWVSTYRAGLNRLLADGRSFKHYNLKNNRSGLVSEHILQLLEDEDGYLWLGTDGGGLSRLDKNTGEIVSFTHEPENDQSLSGNTAWSIFKDSSGRFWIGTQGHGLNLWLPQDRRKGVNRFKHYNIDNGLNSSTVNGVIEDEQGFLWVSTVKGVSRLNPETDEFIHFNLADEIHDNELNQGVLLKTRDGRLYFGGLNGISAFFPDRVERNKTPPKVILTNILSENKPLTFERSVDEIQQLDFDHNDYLLAFDFAALDYSQPDKNHYQYKLEGFDNEWINLGNLNRATFTNLPSGSYLLKVKGSNNDGAWSEESINLKINILPAPWLSWWAFALYGLAVCLFILFLIRMQAKRLANQELFKERVATQVKQKTDLHIKNNQFLVGQIEQMKQQSFFDVDTGLPNQRFLNSMVESCFNWLNCAPIDNQNGWKLQVTLFNLRPGSIDDQTALVSGIESFDGWLTNQGLPINVVRWGEDAIGILRYRVNENNLEEEAKKELNTWQMQLVACFAQQGVEITESQAKWASLVFPLSGVQQSPLTGQESMMLTEHIACLLQQENKANNFFASETLQNIDAIKIRQILDADKLEEIAGIFR